MEPPAQRKYQAKRHVVGRPIRGQTFLLGLLTLILVSSFWSIPFFSTDTLYDIKGQHGSSTKCPMSTKQGLDSGVFFKGNRFETCILKQNMKDPSSSSLPSSSVPEQNPFSSFPSWTKNETMTLQDAFMSNYTTVYFMHQRKAAGSTLREILFDKLSDTIGAEEAKSRSFVPCVTTDCRNYELPVFENNFLGELKLLAGHMSYHIPIARGLYDNKGVSESIFITNFREPLSRIRSCMFYRYPDISYAAIHSKNFTAESMAKILMETKDVHGSTCIQEPFRILSPFDPDKKPVSQYWINQICCFVKSNFHIIDQFEPMNKTKTAIETELIGSLRTFKKKIKNASRKELNDLEERRWIEFETHLKKTNGYVHAEQKLYNCVFDLNDAH